MILQSGSRDDRCGSNVLHYTAAFLPGQCVKRRRMLTLLANPHLDMLSVFTEETIAAAPIWIHMGFCLISKAACSAARHGF